MNIFENLQIDGKPITRIRRPIRNESHPLDGYIDATMMCKAGGKEFPNFMTSKHTNELIDYISSNLRIPRMALVVSKKGGNDRSATGTWVHPEIAVHLAMWVSIPFSVHVESMQTSVYVSIVSCRISFSFRSPFLFICFLFCIGTF